MLSNDETHNGNETQLWTETLTFQSQKAEYMVMIVLVVVDQENQIMVVYNTRHFEKQHIKS